MVTQTQSVSQAVTIIALLTIIMAYLLPPLLNKFLLHTACSDLMSGA